MKQKMTILVISALALAMSLLSCTNDNDVPGANPGTDPPVCFTAAIGNSGVVATPVSRAAGNRWAPGDSIGIFMLPHSSADIIADALATNRKHLTPDGNGRFIPADTDLQIYYPMDDSPVDFIAYYPYVTAYDGSTDVGGFLYNLGGVQTTATQARQDVLWTRATGDGAGYRKSTATAPVSLAFRHVLAKLTMRCKVDPSVGTVPTPGAMTVTIRGMNTAVFISLNSGSPGVSPGSSEAITPRQLDAAPSGFYAAYDALIIPTTYTADAVTVDFVLGGETFTWHVDTVTFESGKNHVYDVLITRTGVKATGTIEDWTTEDMGGVEAN